MTPKERAVPRRAPHVRLREHPKIHWPPGAQPNPPWAGPGPEFPDPVRVALTNVELVPPDKHMKRHLTLTGAYGGNLYRTTFAVDDPSLLTNLCKSLHRCRGETIAEIGSHQVDRALNLG